MRGLIEAHMRLKGLKCYSHQSKISYTSKLNFPRSQVLFLDELRKIRNKIKYEGVDNNLQYAETVENFMDNIYFKLLQEVRKLLAEHKKV
ncbi:MAG: hypothetical protein MAG795_00477 [Candidatus Woesearchaeota archaeon]|nr:hypothetical protein [Candidatus Woesearchaeota archaeon]